MVNPLIVETAKKSSGIFGKLFKFLFRYKLASIFIIYILLSLVVGGFQTGDWQGTALRVGGELINPLEDANNRLNELNAGVTGMIDSLFGYLLLYFAFYKIWLWFRVVLFVVNFFTKEANSPAIRIVMSLLVFTPLFYSLGAFHSAMALGESMFYPFTLTADVFNGLIQLIMNPQFSFKFDLFGEAVNTCLGNSTCVA